MEEIDDGDAIRIDMKEILGVDFVPSKSSDCNICRVPALMFEENSKAYIPNIVSIGPIHHDQKHLQSMGTRKTQYFQNFISRSSPKLKKYVKVVTDLAERAERCYPDVKIERKRFVVMMVVDGCFILELLHRVKDGDYSYDEASWVTYAMLDLILVENQLPFFVLEELYRVFIEDSDGAADTCTRLLYVIFESLVKWVMGLLFSFDLKANNSFANVLNQILQMGKPNHLLAIVRILLIPSPTESQQQQQEMISDENKKQNEDDNPAMESQIVMPLQSARDLKNANVKFKKNKNATSLLDINFDNAKGILTIPPIQVHDGTEPILRNLIAYEFYSDDYSYIAEYMLFLNSLINSGKDVELLQKSEIFSSILAQPSDVAKLFYSLSKFSTIVDDKCTKTVSRKLNKYYNKQWNKWKASLMLNYFNTPWAFVSVLTAIILLGLTFTQTMYAGLSYD